MYKHTVLFCAYLLITCFTVFAQLSRQAKIYEQYLREIQDQKNIKEDTGKVLLYLEFAGQLHASSDTVLAILKKAKDLSYKLNYQLGIERTIRAEGCYEIDNHNDYPSGVRYFRDAAKIAESHKFYNDIYLCYSDCLNAYYYLADYPNALDIAQKGLSLAEQFNDKENQAHYDNQIGFIYLKQGNADESIKYNKRYLALGNVINRRMMIADAYNEIGDDYLLKKDYKTSLGFFFRALDIYLGIKKKFNNKGEEIREGELFDGVREAVKHDRVAYTSFKISTVYKLAGNYKSALEYSRRIFEISDQRAKKGWKSFNDFDRANYYTNAGDIYRLLKDYKNAEFFLHKGFSLAKTIGHREDMRDACEALSASYATQRRYDSAYCYHVLFTGLKDSIINEKVSHEISNLEVGRKEREITLLNQQQKLKEAETSRQTIKRNFIIGFTALIAVISFLLLYVRNRVKQQKLVFEKQLAIQAERQRISSDMHDDVGSGLSTMLLYVNMLKMKLADSGDGANIDRISALGTGLVDQMKEIVWSLSPGNDRLDSLLLFMREYFVSLFEPLPHQVSIDFPSTIPDIKLEGNTRRNIFLCVKESLNNVIKHAGATCVELRMQIVRHTLVIEIKDNGRGFTAGETTGNGLKNMCRRMNAIKGKFNISNNNGTVVRLELGLPPYPNG
jgi:two-component system NarL family sensor kinase